MEATDLMIGDWIFYKNFKGNLIPHKIIGISKNYVEFEDHPYNTFEIKKIQPILLTSEILETNNFQKDPDYIDIYWRPDCRKFCIVKELDAWYFAIWYKGGHICITKCNYVHKLQYILKDLEIEKEIIL